MERCLSVALRSWSRQPLTACQVSFNEVYIMCIVAVFFNVDFLKFLFLFSIYINLKLNSKALPM